MSEINQDYYAYTFPGSIDELSLASLYELGFESFYEQDDCTQGFLPFHLKTTEIDLSIKSIFPDYSVELIKQQNWNALWEASFEPIRVGDLVNIRASFHPFSAVLYDLIIDPKMAFGTGHHATTYMMIDAMTGMDFKEKCVIDFGCGSGVLAILSSKMGATDITAIDYDIWSVENTKENTLVNNTEDIKILQADSLKIISFSADIILANITRDILMPNTGDVSRILKKGGQGLYSGFLKTDLDMMKEHLRQNGLTVVGENLKEDWCVLTFIKP